jgi:hypothetical protein
VGDPYGSIPINQVSQVAAAVLIETVDVEGSAVHFDDQPLGVPTEVDESGRRPHVGFR